MWIDTEEPASRPKGDAGSFLLALGGCCPRSRSWPDGDAASLPYLCGISTLANS